MSDYKRTTHNPYSTEFAIPCYLCKHIEERPIRNKQKCSMEECDYLKCYEKLAELEDVIEQNVLIKLPCKVGDTIYYIDRYWQQIYEYEVYGFSINSKYEVLITVEFGIFGMSKDEIFLTKAEAEAELAKIRGQK